MHSCIFSKMRQKEKTFFFHLKLFNIRIEDALLLYLCAAENSAKESILQRSLAPRKAFIFAHGMCGWSETRAFLPNVSLKLVELGVHEIPQGRALWSCCATGDGAAVQGCWVLYVFKHAELGIIMNVLLNVPLTSELISVKLRLCFRRGNCPLIKSWKA